MTEWSNACGPAAGRYPVTPLAELSTLLGWDVADVEQTAPGRWLLLVRRDTGETEMRAYSSREIRAGRVLLGLDADTSRGLWLRHGRTVLRLMHEHIEHERTGS